MDISRGWTYGGDKCGLTVRKPDGGHLGRPVLTSPEGTGSLRYIYHADTGDTRHFHYEYARADGAHELRVSQVG